MGASCCAWTPESPHRLRVRCRRGLSDLALGVFPTMWTPSTGERHINVENHKLRVGFYYQALYRRATEAESAQVTYA